MNVKQKLVLMVFVMANLQQMVDSVPVNKAHAQDMEVVAHSTPIYIVNKATGQNMQVIGRHKMDKGKGAWGQWHLVKNAAGKEGAIIASNKADLYNIQLSANHEYACVLGKYAWSASAPTYPLMYKGDSFAGQYAFVISGLRDRNKQLMDLNAVQQDLILSKIVPLPNAVQPSLIKSIAATKGTDSKKIPTVGVKDRHVRRKDQDSTASSSLQSVYEYPATGQLNQVY